MSIEGGRDRPGNNHLLNVLIDHGWNQYTGKACRMVSYTNKTGSASVRGSLVKFSTTDDNSVVLTAANDQECIGAVYESGISDGSEVRVICGGSAQVLHINSLTTSALPGNWVRTANAAGRANAITAAPPLGGVAQLDQHMQEVGHCAEEQAPGTNVLVEINMHFN